MTIYIDLVFLLNFFFDLLLLIGVKILLKRSTKLLRLIFGALVGSISIFLLFLKINSLELFAFKVLISLIMIWCAFSYKNIRYFFKNFVTLYIVSAVLGGFLYFLNISFSYKNQGLIFFHNGLSINFIFLIIISPFIIYLYVKEHRRLKSEYQNYYTVKINFNHHEYLLTGYLDTGNNLIDPITCKKVILINRKILNADLKNKSPIFVRYNALNTSGIIECFKPEKVQINNNIIPDILLGISDNEFKMENIDCILNNQIKELFNV